MKAGEKIQEDKDGPDPIMRKIGGTLELPARATKWSFLTAPNRLILPRTVNTLDGDD